MASNLNASQKPKKGTRKANYVLVEKVFSFNSAPLFHSPNPKPNEQPERFRKSILERQLEIGRLPSHRLVRCFLWLRHPFQGAIGSIFGWRSPSRILDGPARLDPLFRFDTNRVFLFHEQTGQGIRL